MMPLFQKKFFFLLILLIVASGLFLFYIYYSKPQPPAVTSQPPVNATTSQQVAEMRVGPCLADDEYAEYRAEKREGVPSVAAILVKEKDSNNEVFEFGIENVKVGHYHAYEIHKCNVYIVREFNYDYRKGKALPNYKIEIWQYQYDGKGKELVEIDDFRVDSVERYIAFLKGYLGSSDYAIVIKDLKTLNDVFTLPMSEIEKRNLEIVGDMQFENWSSDGRYLWANTAYGANTLGFIRIDTKDRSVKLLPAPKDVLGGDALNLEKGLITVHPGNVWFGVSELDEQEKAKRRAQGIGTELYIYNLFTGKQLFVASTTEPLYYFKPKWPSDTELEYYFPSGEREVYRVVE
ncbi:MAG: hypothetical protein V1696_03100 [Candidatus Jorgensenbacteria bacterium]